MPPGAPGGLPTLPAGDGTGGDRTTADTASGGSGTAVAADRQIIRTGEISLTVESIDSASRALSALVASAGGYLAGSARSRVSGSALTGTVEVRVPSNRFEVLLDGVRRLGRVELESISASDVTEEYIDLQARLKGQQQLEARILKLLEERPGKLADVVEIEQKLAEVRSVIETIQGRLRYLGARVAYSTLTVRMTEPGAIGTSETDTFGGRMKRAFDEGTEALVTFLAGLLTLLMALLPLIALLLLGWWLVRRTIRARKAGAAAATEASAARPGVARSPSSRSESDDANC
jgi:hypothetical protein